MISSRTTRSRAIRRSATSIVMVLCCTIPPIGCGEPATQQSNMPSDFAEKLEKEHPELFIKKTGQNKTEVLGGRDKRDIVRREWLKAQQGNP